MSELKPPQINSVIVSGNTVHRVKMTATKSGDKIANLRIACNRGFGEKKQTSFFDVVAFGKTAEFIERDCSAEHGVPVLIEGTLQQREWTDKEGVKRSTVEIICNRFSCLAWPDKVGAATAEDDESPL